MGTARGLEARVVPREGFALELIRSGGLTRQAPLALVRSLALLPVSALDAWRIIRKQSPHLIIGVGGYSSGPVVLIAALRHIPTMVLEQNAVPGLTNRILSHVVEAAAVTYDTTLPYFEGKGFISGNPVRPEFFCGRICRADRGDSHPGGKTPPASSRRLSGGSRDQRGHGRRRSRPGGGVPAAVGDSSGGRARSRNGQARVPTSRPRRPGRSVPRHRRSRDGRR